MHKLRLEESVRALEIRVSSRGLLLDVLLAQAADPTSAAVRMKRRQEVGHFKASKTFGGVSPSLVELHSDGATVDTALFTVMWPPQTCFAPEQR